MTLKDCDSLVDGRCNVMHQLTSKFFDDQPSGPGTLQVDGVALLAFGTPSAPVRRLVNIRGSLEKPNQERNLQEAGPNSEFGLQAELVGGAAPATQSDSGSDNSGAAGIIGGAIAGVAVVALVVAFVVIRRQRSEDEEEEENSAKKTVEDDIDAKA